MKTAHLFIYRLVIIFVVVFICSMVDLRVMRAETIVVSDTVPTQVTNWHNALQIPTFQPSWGMLTSITMTLETPIVGTVSYENTSDETVTITSMHAVSINLQLLDGTLLDTFPNITRVDTAAPFDGVSDFGGESGDSFSMNTTLVATQHYTTPEDLALFYQGDMLTFPITATGASYIAGPGNYDAILRAQAAGVNFTIFFNFLPIEFAFAKLTNGYDADDPNGDDLPVLLPGAPITWTYLLTNTGMMTITESDIRLTDNDPAVVPTLDRSSDNGDGLLAPGEVWHYLARGSAVNLRTSPLGDNIVSGCAGNPNIALQRAYENIATVVIGDNQRSDPSHYCNPTTRSLVPGITMKKYIDGADANDANGDDVPFYFPGATITWTYLVTNTGDISFTRAAVIVTDDDQALTVTFDESSDDGDLMLAPGEQWRFTAVGVARNLLLDSSGITTVDGCDPNNTGTSGIAYRNIGTATVNLLSVNDPSHYCVFPPTVVAERDGDIHDNHAIYLPLIAK